MSSSSHPHRLVLTFCVAVICCLTGCGNGKPGAFSGNGYHVRDGIVWFLSDWTSQAFEVTSADAATFKFPLPNGTNSDYAKDAKHVFLRGQIIPGADPATFEVLRGVFSRDAKQVYAGREVFCDDAPHFEMVSINFVKNGHSVYRVQNNGQAETVSEDVANFRQIRDDEWHSYCADSTQVFVNGNLISGADPQSFRVLGGGYAGDAEHTFYFDKPLPDGTDAATLTPLAGGYAKDNARAYYLGKVLQGADAASFEITDPQWPKARDKGQSYEQGSISPRRDS